MYHNRNDITGKAFYATSITKKSLQFFNILNKIIRIRLKNPFHNLIGQFAPAVLVDDTFVVHRPRPTAKPLVTDADIAELPDVHTAASFVLEDSCQLLFQRLCLILLRPLCTVIVPASIDRTCSDLSDQKRFPASLSLILHPLVQIIEIFHGRRVVIPEWIDIVGDDFRQAQTNVRFELAARRGARS